MVTVAEEEAAISVVQRAWRAGVARTVVKALLAARRVEELKVEAAALHQERVFLEEEVQRGNNAMSDREQKAREFICSLEKRQREAEPSRPPKYAPASRFILGSLLDGQHGAKSMSVLYTLWEPAAAVRIQSQWRSKLAKQRVAQERAKQSATARGIPGARAAARREAGCRIQRFVRTLIAKHRVVALRRVGAAARAREQEAAVEQEVKSAAALLGRLTAACMTRQKLALEARARVMRVATVPAAVVAATAVGALAVSQPPRGVLLRVLRSLAHPSLWMCSTRTDELAETEPAARSRCVDAEAVARQGMERQFQREGCGIASAAGDWSSVALFLLPDAAAAASLNRLGIQPLAVRGSLQSREAARRNEITGMERVQGAHAESQQHLRQLLHTAGRSQPSSDNKFLWKLGCSDAGAAAARSASSVNRPQRLAPLH
eukprot:Hpha_TRINITY_DN16499_c0_g15::TRINITY_DN16499_c0_g15_i1::g.159342::m.159342